MDINHELYKVFYHVAKTLSFSEASKELFISQSAVSQSVKVLEKRLGQKLFVRSTKRVRLTKEGEILFSHERYPNVHIKVVNGTSLKCVEYLKNGVADLVVVNTPNSALGQVGKILPVKEFRDIFVANKKAFPKLINGVHELSELQNYPMMMLDKVSTTSEFLHKLFLENHLELLPEIELASNDLLIDLARIGLGIACIPDYCIDEENEEELFVLKMKDLLPERGIAACYNDMGQTAESVFQFLNLLKSE